MAKNLNTTAITEFPCVARRHMDAEFRLYDAMLAIAKAGANERKAKGEWKLGDPLRCYAKETTLANMIDRSVTQVRDMLRKLDGWVISTHDDRRRKRAGNYTTNEWRIVEHDEFAANHPDSCPALLYHPETGAKLKPGELAIGLARAKVRKIPDSTGFMASLPDPMADMIVNAIRERKANVGNPIVDAEPREEILRTSNVGNPANATLGNPTDTTAGNPLTSLKVEAGIDSRTKISSQPALDNEPGRQAGRNENTRSDSLSTKTKWQEFIRKAKAAELCEEMLFAEPNVGEHETVLARLEKYDDDFQDFIDDINDWAEAQSPPLATLYYGRWTRWLEQT